MTIRERRALCIASLWKECRCRTSRRLPLRMPCRPDFTAFGRGHAGREVEYEISFGEHSMKNISRRTFMLSMAAYGLVANTVPIMAQTRKKITVVSWGGAYQRAQSKAVWQPAASALGITLVEETYNGLADLRLRGRSGTGGWDVVSIGSGGAARAGAENILQPLDYGAIDVSTFFHGYHSKYWVAGD